MIEKSTRVQLSQLSRLVHGHGFEPVAFGKLVENLDSGFATELKVDGDGLVKDYPETFRRNWPTW